jgi:hypothetical protein
MKSGVKMKLYRYKWLIFFISVFLFMSCDSYLKFEVFRLKFLGYVFLVTLILGFIGFVFSDKDK